MSCNTQELRSPEKGPAQCPQVLRLPCASKALYEQKIKQQEEKINHTTHELRSPQQGPRNAQRAALPCTKRKKNKNKKWKETNSSRGISRTTHELPRRPWQSPRNTQRATFALQRASAQQRIYWEEQNVSTNNGVNAKGTNRSDCEPNNERLASATTYL